MFQQPLKVLSTCIATLTAFSCLGLLTACEESSGVGGNPASQAPATGGSGPKLPPTTSTTTVAAAPGEPAMPLDKDVSLSVTNLLDFGNHRVYQDTKTGYSIVTPGQFSAEINLTSINPQISVLTNYAGSTWTEKCQSYRTSIIPVLDLLRETTNKKEKEAYTELLKNQVYQGAWKIGRMSLKLKLEDDLFVRSLLNSSRVRLSTPATFVRAVRRSDIRPDVLGRPRSLETFQALAGDFKEENFVDFIFNEVDATTNQFCDILLEQNEYYVNIAPFALSSFRLNITESPSSTQLLK